MKFYSCDLCGKLYDNESLEICIVCKTKVCKDCCKKSGGYCRKCCTKMFLKNLTNN